MKRCELLFPEGRPKALTFSYDDGVEQDIRLIEILNKHGLKGTFNINSGLFAPEGTAWPAGQIHRRLTEKAALALYADSGHEVAVHTVTHPFLERLPATAVIHEILEDRRRLETLFGGVIRGMAYPMGTYSDAVVKAVRAAGIAYSRTVASTENFHLPQDWLRLPATCHHNNPRLMELAERFLQPGEWGLFYLWGHSYEFEIHDNWHVIEEFAAKMSGKSDIWYATNIEIYDYITAYRNLQCNADYTCVYNPSVLDVWVRADGRAVHVPAGETVEL